MTLFTLLGAYQLVAKSVESGKLNSRLAAQCLHTSLKSSLGDMRASLDADSLTYN